MPLDKPRLIYAASIRRGRHFKRFLRYLLLVATCAGAYLALAEAARRGLVGAPVLDVGQLVAVVLGALFSIRGLLNLLLTFIRRSEAVRFYDQGFAWARGKTQHKYAWHQLASYREGARGIYIGRLPLLQWGANTLTMNDGKVFRYTGRFGDTRGGAAAIRRYTAYVTGVQMGRALRSETPVKLHRHLTLFPTGIETGKHDIHWSEVDVRMDKGQLVIRKLDDKGHFRTVSRYQPYTVDNLGGLLELTRATLPNYQPERFKKRASL